ncbi:hypothetical protein LTS18_007131, partial [Coniosporium uncinatum]
YMKSHVHHADKITPESLNKMGIPVHTTTEKPSNSETTEGSVPSASVPDQKSQVGSTGPDVQKTKSEAEKAADKLYEERIEDEYAKREGGA